MKVLVACEFSGVVRDAFRVKGHDAWSCDLLPCDADPTYHIQGDVREVLDKGWDLMIAHPPCQYLTYAGIAHWNKPGRAEKRDEAKEFFLTLYNAAIPKICVENPVGWMNTCFRKPDQIVQPWQFGERENKRTCYWTKGLPKLVPTNIVDKPEPIYVCKNGLRPGRKLYRTDALTGSNGGWKTRSISFKGISEAMADQWGKE
jgi:hypothetical protein